MEFDMKKGFTLSELLVAIALIGIFSAFSVVSLRSGSQLREVRNEAMKVLDGIKKMQTMALAGKSVDGETPQRYVFRLADCAESCDIFSLVTDAGSAIEPPAALENAVMKISGLDSLEISFSPPRAQPVLSTGENEVTIRVESAKDPNAARCVSVNAVSGRIDLSNCP